MINLFFQKKVKTAPPHSYLDSSIFVNNFYNFFLSTETANSITDNGGCVVVDVNNMRHTITQQQLVNRKVSKVVVL